MAKDTPKTWTTGEVVEESLQALGKEIARLRKARSLSPERGFQLCAYVKAAVALAADSRAALKSKELGDVSDEQLMGLIAKELGVSFAQLREVVDGLKKSNGARAS